MDARGGGVCAPMETMGNFLTKPGASAAWIGVLEGGCLGRGLCVLNACNHENNEKCTRTFFAQTLVGACAMTTKFLDNKIRTFKILLSWRFPRKTKNSVLGDFPLCPQSPPLSKPQILFLLSSRRSDLLRSFEKGLADRGGWHEEILERPGFGRSFWNRRKPGNFLRRLTPFFVIWAVARTEIHNHSSTVNVAIRRALQSPKTLESRKYGKYELNAKPLAIHKQTHPNLYPLAGDDRCLTYSNGAVQIRLWDWSLQPETSTENHGLGKNS